MTKVIDDGPGARSYQYFGLKELLEAIPRSLDLVELA